MEEIGQYHGKALFNAGEMEVYVFSTVDDAHPKRCAKKGKRCDVINTIITLIIIIIIVLPSLQTYQPGHNMHRAMEHNHHHTLEYNPTEGNAEREEVSSE